MIFLIIIFIILLYIIFRIFNKYDVIEKYQLTDISKWKTSHNHLMDVLEETDILLDNDIVTNNDLITQYNNVICNKQKYYNIDNSDMNNMFMHDESLHLKPNTTYGVVKSNITHIVQDALNDCRPSIANYTTELRCDLTKQPCLTYDLEEIIDYGGSKIVFSNQEVCKFDQCTYYCDDITFDCWKYDDGYIKAFRNFNGCLENSNINKEHCYSKPNKEMCPDKQYYYVYQDINTLQHDKIDTALYDKSIDYISESNMYVCKYTPHHSNWFNTYDDIINHCGQHPSNVQCYYRQGDEFILYSHTFDLLDCSYNSNENCYLSFGSSLCKNTDIVDNQCIHPIDCETSKETIYTTNDESHVENVFTRVYQQSNISSRLVDYQDYMKCEYPKVSSLSYITNMNEDCKTVCYNPSDLTSNVRYGIINQDNHCKVYDCYNYTTASNIYAQRLHDALEARRIANEQTSYTESLVNDASRATTLANEYERQANELENGGLNHCTGNYEYVWTKDPVTLQEYKYDSIEQIPNSTSVKLKSSNGGEDLLIEPLTNDAPSLTSFSEFNDTLWYYPWANYNGLCERKLIRKINKTSETDTCIEVIEEKEGNTCVAINPSLSILNIENVHDQQTSDITTFDINDTIVIGHEYIHNLNNTLSVVVSENNEIFLKKNNLLNTFEYIFRSVTNIDNNINWIPPVESTFTGSYRKMNVDTSLNKLFVLVFKQIDYVNGNRIESDPYRLNIILDN